MKTMRIMNVLLAGMMALAAACAGEAVTGDSGPGAVGYSAAAGDQARAQGIDSYFVHLEGTASHVQLLDIDGVSLGQLIVDQTADFQSVRFASARSANTVSLRASKAGYAIAVNGVDRIRLTAGKDGSIENTLDSDLSDVTPELALLNAVMNEGAQINANGTTAYVVPDCPWYFSLLACAGCATAEVFVAPCIACGACLASYLV